jgi:hypothetical protein
MLVKVRRWKLFVGVKLLAGSSYGSNEAVFIRFSRVGLVKHECGWFTRSLSCKGGLNKELFHRFHCPLECGYLMPRRVTFGFEARLLITLAKTLFVTHAREESPASRSQEQHREPRTTQP